MLLLLQYYCNDVRPANEAAHGLSRAKTRAGPCTTCTKKSRRVVYSCDEVFSRTEIPSAHQVQVETTMWYRYNIAAVVLWIEYMPRRAPLRAGSPAAAVIICCTRREPTSTPLRSPCAFFLQMSDQSLGAELWVYRGRSLPSPRRRKHFMFLPGSCRTEPPVEAPAIL